MGFESADKNNKQRNNYQKAAHNKHAVLSNTSENFYDFGSFPELIIL